MNNELRKGAGYMRLTPDEIVAALLIAAPKDTKEIFDMCGENGERLPGAFVHFASLLYSRGFDHGMSEAYGDACERLTCAGQTAGAALVQRIGAHVNGQ